MMLKVLELNGDHQGVDHVHLLDLVQDLQICLQGGVADNEMRVSIK